MHNSSRMARLRRSRFRCEPFVMVGRSRGRQASLRYRPREYGRQRRKRLSMGICTSSRVNHRHDSSRDEGHRKPHARQLGDLARQREDARADHHACSHRHRANKCDAVLAILRLHGHSRIPTSDGIGQITVSCPIIPRSSCSRMWQWNMKGWLGGAGCSNLTSSSVLSRTRTVSFQPLLSGRGG